MPNQSHRINRPRVTSRWELNLSFFMRGLAMSYQFLRLPEVLRRTGLSRTALYEQIKNKAFPKPIRIAKRSVAWTDEDVNRWCNDRIALSRLETESETTTVQGGCDAANQ
jgi:prophage regulatory protein